MKKRFLLWLGLVALLGTGLFATWWRMEPRTGICESAAKRIKFGMTKEEVIRNFGLSPSEQFEFDVSAVNDDEEFGKTVIDFSGEIELFDVLAWNTRQTLIQVFFREDGLADIVQFISIRPNGRLYHWRRRPDQAYYDKQPAQQATTGICRNSISRIRLGMTQDEVQEIIGPYGDYRWNADHNRVSVRAFGDTWTILFWHGNDGTITVRFDGGRVTEKQFQYRSHFQPKKEQEDEGREEAKRRERRAEEEKNHNKETQGRQSVLGDLRVESKILGP